MKRALAVLSLCLAFPAAGEEVTLPALLATLASGGSIALTTPDGATFTLEFPAGSLSGPTDISLEPVTRIDPRPGWTLTPCFAGAVLPNGLHRIRATPAAPTSPPVTNIAVDARAKS